VPTSDHHLEARFQDVDPSNAGQSTSQVIVDTDPDIVPSAPESSLRNSERFGGLDLGKPMVPEQVE
jgi:hypothetical protein